MHSNCDPVDNAMPSAGGEGVHLGKIKQLIQHLNAAYGSCASLVSLILPPTESIPHMDQRLARELALASSILPRWHRIAKMGAITAATQMLRGHSELPPNGLIIYCGEITHANGREDQIKLQFEPHKKVEEIEYHIDTRFHTEAIASMLRS